MDQITVRLRSQGGRVRLQNVSDSRFVQCPRGWRDALPAGRALAIQAKMRADGECWVAAQRPVPVLS